MKTQVERLEAGKGLHTALACHECRCSVKLKDCHKDKNGLWYHKKCGKLIIRHMF
jgi:hypothetical protein